MIVHLCSSAGVSTGVLLLHDGDALLVDTGDGLARDLSDLGIEADAVVGVAITHDHGDHVAGLPALLWWMHVARRKAPLPFLRPSVAPLLDGLAATYPESFAGEPRFELEPQTNRPDRTVQLGPFLVQPFAVNHRRSSADPVEATMEAFGFEVRAADCRVVISGDTGPCDELASRARGADLAILDATFDRDDEREHQATHMTMAEAQAIGRRARHAIYCHRRR